MDFIELLFKLIAKFVPIDSKDYDEMYNEATKARTKWADPENDSQFGKFYTKYMREWWVKLIIAVLYVPAVRWVMEYMNPILDDKED